MPGRQDNPPRQGIELSTLVVTAVASAVAAYVVSKLWTPGTLAAAAMTPVLVAVIKEALQRPVERVATVAPAIARRREPGRTTEWQAGDEGPIHVHGTSRHRRGVQIAVVTGLLGFAIAAAVLTVPDLVAGRSLLGDRDRGTTLFGGTARHASKHKRTGDGDATQTTQTVTRTVPGATPARPQTTTPAPAATTTAPPDTATQPPAQTETTPPAPSATTQTAPPG